MGKTIQYILLLSLLTGLSACSTQSVKSTTFTPIDFDSAIIPEDELLDIGIAIFDPGLDQIDENREELTFSDIRLAETFFVSHHLSETLQSNGNWGVVRVIPHELSSSDVAITGTILQSDGETMRLHVNVKDATGRVWINKEYEEAVSKYSYDPRLRRSEDSFQGLFNKIANDILQFRMEKTSREQLLAIRTVSELQFAKAFAPEVFDEYLDESGRGIIEVKRLPASNDPVLARIDTIRERDNLYIDTLQDYYSTFVRQMLPPYTEFRRISYDEIMKLDKLEAQARRNMIIGVASIIGGIAATGSNNNAVQYAGPAIGIGAGTWLVKDAFNKRAEAQMHVEALAELGNSLEMEIAPQTIELEERTVTLSGSVETQYEQWREILADIYNTEAGE